MSSLPFVLHYPSTLLSWSWLSLQHIPKRSSLCNFIFTQFYNYNPYSRHTKTNSVESAF
jgi:hypothetical protein